MTPKKKVILICDKNSCTSFGRLVLDFERTLYVEFDVRILWLKTPRYFPDSEEKVNGDFLTASSLYTGFFAFRKPLEAYLRREVPDIVLFIRPELGFLIPFAKKACPKAKIIMQIHDTFAETLYPHSVKFKLISTFFVRKTVMADAFAYDSRYAKEEAEAYYGTAHRKNSVLGIPINLFLFNTEGESPSGEERRLFRERLGMHGFGGMCLNVSLDEPRKNLETFLNMARLRENVAFVRIGKLTPRLQVLIERMHLKNVFHFSAIPTNALRSFYRHADLFVFPSWVEGFGLPPLEAIACGTPVVCADTSGLHENLEGICPLISPPDNVEGYLAVLDAALCGEQKLDSEKVQTLLARFSMNAIAERLTAFFNSLLDR